MHVSSSTPLERRAWADDAAGFAAEVWEPPAVAPAVGELTSEPADPNPPAELELIMPDRDARTANLRNIAGQRIGPVLAVLRRAS